MTVKEKGGSRRVGQRGKRDDDGQEDGEKRHEVSLQKKEPAWTPCVGTPGKRDRTPETIRVWYNIVSQKHSRIPQKATRKSLGVTRVFPV